MAEVARCRLPVLATLCMALLCNALGAEAPSLPGITTEGTNLQKGFIGEQYVRELLSKTNRVDMLVSKWSPTQTGPDLLYRLPDGAVEIHEVKTYTDWPGDTALHTKVGGKPMQQLSDDWIDRWVQRQEWASDRAVADEVQAARKGGKLVRIKDDICLRTGEYRSRTAYPTQHDAVRLEERAGPFKIPRVLDRLEESKAKLGGLRRESAEAAGRLFPQARLRLLSTSPGTFEDYEKIATADSRRGVRVVSGLLLDDGRLAVAVETAVGVGVLVFAMDAGVAAYQYQMGAITTHEFELQVAKAAVTGASIGGATAVAVLMGASAGGPIVLGIGIGAYWIEDAGWTTWEERTMRHLLSMDDLIQLGIETSSPLNIERYVPSTALDTRGPPTVLAPPRPMTALDAGHAVGGD